MNTKLYVGNLLYECTDDDLRQLFSQFGEVVSAEIVRYKKSRRSKGFGYVRFAAPESAQQAIETLNGQDFQGRRLMLAEARSADPTPEVMEEIRKSKQRQPGVSSSVGRGPKQKDAFTPIPVSHMSDIAVEEPAMDPEDVSYYAAPAGTRSMPSVAPMPQDSYETAPVVEPEAPAMETSYSEPQAAEVPPSAPPTPPASVQENVATAPAAQPEKHTSLQDHMRSFGNIFSKKEDK